MTSISNNKQVIQQTSPSLEGKARVDLNKSDFDALIHQKGYDVYVDKALKCPCSAVNNSHALPSCRNCGGIGWVFLNRIKTRLILQSMNVDTKYKEWGEERLGTVKLTARKEEELSNMDRIVLIDAESTYNEFLFPTNINENFQGNPSLQARCAFDIIKIECIFTFSKSDQPLVRLIEGTDFSISQDHPNIIIFDEKYANQEDFTVSVRYKHAPIYHIIDLSRDVMVTDMVDRKTGKDISVLMPIHAICRRAQYVLDEQNIYNDYLIDNSYGKTCDT